MSGGAVFQEALRWVCGMGLSDVAQRDLVAVMEGARPGPLTLLYEAGHAAGLSRERLLTRAGALYLVFASGNLADDLVDGDCDYLAEPIRHGPGIQYLCQHAFVSMAIAGGVASADLDRACRQLAKAASGHQEEVRVSTWTAERYRQVGRDIAGRQYAGYFSILWSGTPLAPLAEPIGIGLAVAGHVAEDVRSDDPRFWSMTPSDRQEIVAWARACLKEAQAHGLLFVEPVVVGVEKLLEKLA